ncbi:MAG TPA: hypothetical protein VE262_06465 [Blastocatellia bacterium]|nr:hypothetical protein [Blastocatellia bacterium]
MFCPQCGLNQSDELKFCKSCGANLYAVRQAVTTRDTDEKFDWNKTWVAEMLLSSEEQNRRKQERQTNITAEEKRYNEIKAGVITTSVGIAVAIFLFVFMRGIILGGRISDGTEEILSRVWVAGVIPFFIGLGLIFNGVVVSKKLVEIKMRELRRKETGRILEATGKNGEDVLTPTADWQKSAPPGTSVTEHTTRHLRDSG